MRLLNKLKYLFNVVVAAERSYDAPSDHKLAVALTRTVCEPLRIEKKEEQQVFEQTFPEYTPLDPKRKMAYLQEQVKRAKDNERILKAKEALEWPCRPQSYAPTEPINDIG